MIVIPALFSPIPHPRDTKALASMFVLLLFTMTLVSSVPLYLVETYFADTWLGCGIMPCEGCPLYHRFYPYHGTMHACACVDGCGVFYQTSNTTVSQSICADAAACKENSCPPGNMTIEYDTECSLQPRLQPTTKTNRTYSVLGEGDRVAFNDTKLLKVVFLSTDGSCVYTDDNVQYAEVINTVTCRDPEKVYACETEGGYDRQYFCGRKNGEVTLPLVIPDPVVIHNATKFMSESAMVSASMVVSAVISIAFFL